MFTWLVLMGCVSEHQNIQRKIEVDSIMAIVEVTPRLAAKKWIVDMVIKVDAPPYVDVSIPIKTDSIGSFNLISQGFGGGGSSDGSTITKRSYELDPQGFGLQVIPVINIPYIDKRAISAGERKVLQTEDIQFFINRWY